MRSYILAMALGVSLSTFAQSNPQLNYETFNFNACRNPPVALNKFYASGADFRTLLTEQSDLAKNEATDRQTADRLVCTAEAFSQAYRGVVRDGSMTMPTVPKRLINKARIVALNIMIKKQGEATPQELNAAAQVMIDTVDLIKPYLDNGAAFARSGIHFARIVNDASSSVDTDSRKKMLDIAVRSLLGDLQDDIHAGNYFREIISLRSIVNAPGKNSNLSSLSSELGSIIQRAEAIRRTIRD